MKKTTIVIKWIGMLLWFGIPFVLKKHLIRTPNSTLVIVWLILAVALAVLQYAIASFRLTQHLDIHYPERYKDFKNYRRHSFCSQDISRRFDVIFSFSPPQDEKYAMLKKHYKESHLFMYTAVVYSFVMSWLISSN